MERVRFRQLKPGYHEYTEVTCSVADNLYTVIASVIYVNAEGEEVLVKIFGEYEVLSAQSFNEMDFCFLDVKPEWEPGEDDETSDDGSIKRAG